MRNFQVGISYAREDINIVKQVCVYLKQKNISIFIDYEYRDYLAGKTLDVTLRDIYLNHCQYCIMFISESYVKKKWTSYEREILLEKRTDSLQNNPYTDVLIPIRIDDTQLEGLSPHIAYFDIREESTAEISACVAKKISMSQILQPITFEYLLNTIYEKADELLHSQVDVQYKLEKRTPNDIIMQLYKGTQHYFIHLLCEQNTKENFLKLYESNSYPHKISDVCDAEIYLQNNKIFFINYIFSNDSPAIPIAYSVEQITTLITNKLNVFLKEHKYV